MITDKIKELESLKQKTAALEAMVADERRRAMVALPKEYGFDNAQAFIDALALATGARSRRRGRPPGAGDRRPGKRRRRTHITDEMRAQVKKLFGAGRTSSEIARMVGISMPSVHNIKKALGLVQTRKN